MEIDKPISLSSSSGYDDRHRDPKDYIDQSAAEVSFGFNHLRLDANGSSDSQQLTLESAATDDEDQEEDDDEEEEEEEEEGDFTFMCIGDNESPTSAVFEDGQIRPVFPLFDQTLLFGGDYDGEGRYRLPILPPVGKVFIESPHRSPLSTPSGHEETDGVAAGLYCVSSKESDTGMPELNKKSNSTGFSKLWRFKDKVSRSNSDGRDAFVFLNSSDKTTTSSTASTSVAKANAVISSSKVNGGGKAKVVKKGSKAKTASAHEVYLKKRGEQAEERRRSYLPYRPGVMGFFTNVNGGLSRNVHPF